MELAQKEKEAARQAAAAAEAAAAAAAEAAQAEAEVITEPAPIPIPGAAYTVADAAEGVWEACVAPDSALVHGRACTKPKSLHCGWLGVRLSARGYMWKET